MTARPKQQQTPPADVARGTPAAADDPRRESPGDPSRDEHAPCASAARGHTPASSSSGFLQQIVGGDTTSGRTDTVSPSPSSLSPSTQRGRRPPRLFGDYPAAKSDTCGGSILPSTPGSLLESAEAREKKCGREDEKGRPNRLLLRSASDAYFPQILRVISIPDPDSAFRTAVDAVWEDFLQYAESPGDVAREGKKAKVLAALEGYPDDKVWAEIQRRKGPLSGAPSGRPIKQAEAETLLGSATEVGEDIPEGADFYARRLAFEPVGSLQKLNRLVLIHRLREVMALVGFTRFEAEVPDVDGELKLDVRRADVAREITWLPAVDNRGEGFFLAFKAEEINAWLGRPAAKARGEQLQVGFKAWGRLHPTSKLAWPGLPYLLLHSLSHLLITAVSLECGYAASSIRERIYAGEAGYGILLYTASSDAEGTLGGLVQVGRRLGRHMSTALDLARLCSNDPVCAQHRPEHVQEERFLHGAACHGCLLIAEPSCEQRNEFLDRALVVATVDPTGAEFFADDEV